MPKAASPDDLEHIVMPADLLRQMKDLLDCISLVAARINQPQVLEQCETSDKIVRALMRRHMM